MSKLYTVKFTELLTTIRKDVLDRPKAYREGEALLRTRYSREAVHQRMVQEWERYKDHPTRQAADQTLAAMMTPRLPRGSREEKRLYAENLKRVAQPPDIRMSNPATRMDEALRELPDEEGVYNRATAQAILLLAVMLDCPFADKEHRILGIFGSWEGDPGDEMDVAARWAGRNRLSNESESKRWMNAVRTAWAMQPQSPVREAESGAPGKPLGRPPKYDPKLDEDMHDMWKSNKFSSYLQLADAWNKEHDSKLTTEDAKNAVKRQEERLRHRRPR